jgi:hypothetical protein
MIASAAQNLTSAKLIDQPSDVETCLLEFGNGYIRFYQVGIPLPPTSVTA